MRTIHEAAVQALKDIGRPAHVSELLARIEAQCYYEFRARNAKAVLGMELARRSKGSKQGGEASFMRVGPATYGLLTDDDRRPPATAR